MFKAQENLSIVHQLEIIQVYPCLFSKEGRIVVDLVSLSDVQSTLEGFSVSKCPSPNGWTTDFVWHYSILWVLNC